MFSNPCALSPATIIKQMPSLTLLIGSYSTDLRVPQTTDSWDAYHNLPRWTRFWHSFGSKNDEQLTPLTFTFFSYLLPRQKYKSIKWRAIHLNFGIWWVMHWKYIWFCSRQQVWRYGQLLEGPVGRVWRVVTRWVDDIKCKYRANLICGRPPN